MCRRHFLEQVSYSLKISGIVLVFFFRRFEDQRESRKKRMTKEPSEPFNSYPAVSDMFVSVET